MSRYNYHDTKKRGGGEGVQLDPRVSHPDVALPDYTTASRAWEMAAP